MLVRHRAESRPRKYLTLPGSSFAPTTCDRALAPINCMRNATAVGDLRPRHVSTASRGVRNTVCPPPRAMNATRGLLWPRLASKLKGRLRKGWNAALWSAGDARKRETGSPKRDRLTARASRRRIMNSLRVQRGVISTTTSTTPPGGLTPGLGSEPALENAGG